LRWLCAANPAATGDLQPINHGQCRAPKAQVDTRPAGVANVTIRRDDGRTERSKRGLPKAIEDVTAANGVRSIASRTRQWPVPLMT
jgi:hypothetical protein